VVIPGLRQSLGEARVLPAFTLVGASRGEVPSPATVEELFHRLAALSEKAPLTGAGKSTAARILAGSVSYRYVESYFLRLKVSFSRFTKE